MSDDALQDRYAPEGTCFGCGPRNDRGLRVKSRAQPDGSVVATWRAQKHHEAYAGALSGGVIGTLMDCHSNWTATYHLMRRSGADRTMPNAPSRPPGSRLSGSRWRPSGEQWTRRG